MIVSTKEYTKELSTKTDKYNSLINKELEMPNIIKKGEIKKECEKKDVTWYMGT